MLVACLIIDLSFFNDRYAIISSGLLRQNNYIQLPCRYLIIARSVRAAVTSTPGRRLWRFT